MSRESTALIGADLIVRRLRDHGVRVVFGYPGGQLTPLYDALHRDGTIRHVLARDEQAAGFMADGYARATGQPGVCLAVCGPGVLNAATPLATAFTDSVPMLLLSGQVPRAGRGLRSGYYHENDQLRACSPCVKWAGRAEDVEQIVPLLDRAFAATEDGRPGPALFEVPLDVLREDTTAAPWLALPAPPAPLAPRPEDVEALAALIGSWRRPLLLAGGGVLSAGATPQLRELAERLGAPVFHTAMGKCALPGDHSLAAGLPWHRATSDLRDMDDCFSPLFSQADGLLAVGCRFTQLATGNWTLKLPGQLAQIDVDRDELGRHYKPALAVHAHARLALDALLAQLPARRRDAWTPPRPPREPWQLPGLDLVTPLRRALPPDGIVVADITRLAYILMAEFPVHQPRTFLHPAGYVSMGFGIPAALGARAAFPGRPIVAVVGDGCFLMSGMELATAVQERLPIVVVLINDSSLTLIKAIQQRRYQERYIGVDLLNPDFALFARAFGVRHRAADTSAGFESALREALATDATTLIEVRLPGGG
jgi:thiamine pyrophosphate-dependent acetolactate synthase large subunit-like protein